MTLYATASAQAIAELLELPDPDDLPARGHYTTQEGDPRRFTQLAWLRTAYVMHKRDERDNERLVM